MALPKVDVPIYSVKIPSTGREIDVRPFTVKEEKLLLMAVQSNTIIDITNTTKQIVRNNILSDRVDVDKLPFFDIDFLFIYMRAKSVGNTITRKFICNAPSANHLETACGTSFPVVIDMNNCEIINDKAEKNIDLGQLKVKMKYPSYTLMKQIDSITNDIERNVAIIAGSIDQIVKGPTVYTAKDFTQKELVEFIESLTQEQYKKLEDFTASFPSFVIRTKATCPKCGFEHDILYDDFTVFF